MTTPIQPDELQKAIEEVGNWRPCSKDLLEQPIPIDSIHKCYEAALRTQQAEKERDELNQRVIDEIKSKEGYKDDITYLQNGLIPEIKQERDQLKSALAQCAEAINNIFTVDDVEDKMPNGSIPFHSIPFHSIPFHSIPFHSIPFHSIPFHSIPFHSIPFHSIPFHSWILLSQSQFYLQDTESSTLTPHRSSKFEGEEIMNTNWRRTLLFCAGLSAYGIWFYLISCGSVTLLFMSTAIYSFIITIAFLWLLTSTLFRK